MLTPSHPPHTLNRHRQKDRKAHAVEVCGRTLRHRRCGPLDTPPEHDTRKTRAAPGRGVRRATAVGRCRQRRTSRLDDPSQDSSHPTSGRIRSATPAAGRPRR